MKKWMLVTGLLTLALSLGAQERIPLLDRVAGHRVSCQYVYSLSKDEEPYEEITSGRLVTEGNAFVLDGLGMVIRSDGATRWTLDPEAREVMVESVREDDLLANPALILGGYRRYLNRIKVLASGADSLRFTFQLDEDVVAMISLTQVVFSDPQGKSDFTLDVKSLSADYVVTDLR